MSAKTINQWVTEIHNYAVTKGWWERPRTPLEIHMLCVSELAEATEEVRNNKPSLYKRVILDAGMGTREAEFCAVEPQFSMFGKIEGEQAELADCVIRIFDYFGKQGWDLEEVIRLKHEYNLTRPYRHGNKSA